MQSPMQSPRVRMHTAYILSPMRFSKAPSNVINFKSQGSRKTYKFQRSLQFEARDRAIADQARESSNGISAHRAWKVFKANLPVRKTSQSYRRHEPAEAHKQ